MDTKQVGGISVQAVVLEALDHDWGVSLPLCDNLPYDLIIDNRLKLLKIQVKTAWYDDKKDLYLASVRSSCTNRKVYKHKTYDIQDFDFAVIYVKKLSVFYVMPVEVFLSYKSCVCIVEGEKRQRLPASSEYREAWHLIEKAR